MRIFSTIVLAALAGPVAAATPFDGAFIGVQGGWQQDSTRLAVATGGTLADAHGLSSGFAYGGQIGYDQRVTPRLVLGVEASASGVTGSNSFTDGVNAYRLDPGRTFTATARLGTLVRPDGLLYVRGGYSNARFDVVDAVAGTPRDRDGYTIGVGYEQAVARAVTARLQYDHSDYGRTTLTGTAVDIGADGVTGRAHRNAVTAGLDFHF